MIAARKGEITASAREFGSATFDSEDAHKLLLIWEPLEIVFMDEGHTICQTRGIQLPPVSMTVQLLTPSEGIYFTAENTGSCY